MSLNKAMLLGNVGKDPDVRTLDGGKMVATFSLATTEKGYTLQNGTTVPERTEWHNIVVWGGLAKVVQQYVRKGSQLLIEGKIRTRSYEKDGKKIFTTEIFADEMQMVGGKVQQSQPQQSQQQQHQQHQQQDDLPPWERSGYNPNNPHDLPPF